MEGEGEGMGGEWRGGNLVLSVFFIPLSSTDVLMVSHLQWVQVRAAEEGRTKRGKDLGPWITLRSKAALSLWTGLSTRLEFPMREK